MFSVIVGLRGDFLLSAERLPALYGSFSRRSAPQLQVPLVARPRNHLIFGAVGRPAAANAPARRPFTAIVSTACASSGVRRISQDILGGLAGRSRCRSRSRSIRGEVCRDTWLGRTTLGHDPQVPDVLVAGLDAVFEEEAVTNGVEVTFAEFLMYCPFASPTRCQWIASCCRPSPSHARRSMTLLRQPKLECGYRASANPLRHVHPRRR